MSTSSATPTSVPLQPIILIVTATPSIAATDAPLAPFVARLESAALTVVRVGLCGIVFLFVSIVLTASRVAGRRRRYRQTPVSRPVADKGHLDICSAELETTGEMKRVELEPYVMGEILTVGQGAQFGIDLCGVGSAPLDSDAHAELPSTHDVTLAALIFTPRGPVIEGRAAPLCVEGQVVAQHLFFDGDVVYLDRYAIFYTNFFRRAPPDELGIN